MTAPPANISTTSLSYALDRVQHEEARHLPDVVISLNETSWTPAGMLVVPGHGEVRVNEWARDQLSQLLGIQFERWFSSATPQQQADEMSRRLWRARNKVRLRLTQRENEPVLRAVVGPSYSAVDDSTLVSSIGDSLRDVNPLVHRLEMTQRLTSCVVRFGEAQFVNRTVGDVSGSITLTNSGVGWCKLTVVLSILRLVCSNGMRAPVYEAMILGVRHRCLEPARIRAHLSSEMRSIPNRLKEAIRVLGASTAWPVINVQAEIRELLREVGMIRAHHQEAMVAYHRETHPTVFGVSQALTLHAQQSTAEKRQVLESLAGTYVMRSAP